MATIFQAPQYVPSAESADPSPWAPWTVAFNSPTVRGFEYQRFFGIGGQSPTQRFSPYYTQDDSSGWNWQAPPSDTLRLLTQQKMFGQGGQTPTVHWERQGEYDDSSYWYAAPRSANDTILQASTEQKWPGGGAPGQVPGHEQHYDYDEQGNFQFRASPSWIIRFLTQSMVNPFKIRQMQNWQDDSGGWWQPGAQPQANAINLQVSMFVGKHGAASTPFLGDDAAHWERRNRGRQIITNQVIFPLVFNWPLVNEDQSYYNLMPAPINTLLFQLTAGGFPAAELWDWEFDDHPMWVGGPQQRQPLTFSTTSIAPFFKRWDWQQDDSSPWLASPLAAQPLVKLIATLPPPRASRGWWQIGDDSSGWGEALLPHEARTLIMLTIGGNPFFRQWVPYFDDASGWYPALDNLAAGTLFQLTGGLPVFKTPWHRQWNYPYDEGGFWSGAPVGTLFFTNPGAFHISAVPYWGWPQTNEESSLWSITGDDLASGIIGQLTHQQFFAAGGQGPTKLWVPYQDDSSGWLGTPLGSTLTNILPAKAIFPWQWKPAEVLDDSSGWSPGPQAMPVFTRILNILGQPTQHLWTPQILGQDDPSWWQSHPTASANVANLFTFTGQTKKNWAPWLSLWDDASGWQFQPPPIPLPQVLVPPPGLLNITHPYYMDAYQYDDSSLWYPAPENMAAHVLQALSQGGLLGGGQWPTHDWAPQYTWDDASGWDPTWWRANSPLIQAPVLKAWHSGAYMGLLQQFYYMAADEVWPGKLMTARSSFLPLVQPTPPTVQQIFEWLIRARRRGRR